jgi:hypothetical protein
MIVSLNLMLVTIFSSPVACYSQFGKAIVCSDAAAEAARYGFTAVDRPEGFLVLAIASLGNEITELKSPPEVGNSYNPLWFFHLQDLIFDMIIKMIWDRTQHLWRKRRLE